MTAVPLAFVAGFALGVLIALLAVFAGRQ